MAPLIRLRKGQPVKKIAFLGLFAAVCCSTSVYADEPPPPITYSAMADGYYGYDFNHLNTKKRSYTTQAYYDNEPNLNLGFIEAKLSTDSWRGRFAAQYGTSVIANYAAEPDRFWRYIQEAVIGYKVSDSFWIDSGIYFSHIGFEGWISRDNWVYTRALVSEFSPYYQLGVKGTYQVNDALLVQLNLLRGWQNISATQDPALGLQVAYTPEKTWSFTYNNFVGHQDGGERVFHDLIVKHDFTDSLHGAVTVDSGIQARTEESSAWWFGWAILGRYDLTKQIGFAARCERYSDPHGVIAGGTAEHSFNAYGGSLGVDYAFTPSFVWRNEVKLLAAPKALFPSRNGFEKEDRLLVTSLTYTY